MLWEVIHGHRSPLPVEGGCWPHFLHPFQNLVQLFPSLPCQPSPLMYLLYSWDLCTDSSSSQLTHIWWCPSYKKFFPGWEHVVISYSESLAEGQQFAQSACIFAWVVLFTAAPWTWLIFSIRLAGSMRFRFGRSMHADGIHWACSWGQAQWCESFPPWIWASWNRLSLCLSQ